MANRRNPGPIPNRWIYCPQKSLELIAERFLAFKTPLSEDFDSQVPAEYRFPPQKVFDYVKESKGRIGLWIDLTNTHRFYNRQDIVARGCQYVKVQCRGHAETPSLEQTNSFIEIVDNFINNGSLDVVGVHCTHGFNRTGFLIVSYMVDKMDCSVEAALRSFAKARPPGIYKQEYIEELYRRYDDVEDTPQAPELPDWCFEYDDSDGHPAPQVQKRHLDLPSDDINSNEGTSEAPQTKKRKKERVITDAHFMIDLPDITLVTEQPLLSKVQSTTQNMCRWQGTGFPGSQPVSMTFNNYKYLHDMPYRVSWKADGTRYMMLILGKNEVYFFDRNFSCFHVNNITFPQRTNLDNHLEDTLVDGEMVIDKVNGTEIPRYLIYDVIYFKSKDVMDEKFFPTRMEIIREEIVGARNAALQMQKIRREREPFGVRAKDFWDISQAESLLGPKFAEQLSHEPDGLIFQPSNEPYTPGPSEKVLKWKPLEMNSIDFKLCINIEEGAGIIKRKVGELYVGGLSQPFAKMYNIKNLNELNNKIVECKFENGRWVFMRERTDKRFPNSYSTARAVCESIKNPVTTEVLLDYIREYGFVNMPPPPNKHY